jgi:rhodanese-related sulfurtransferase
MDNTAIIDFSPPEEHNRISIPGSLNIPLERLRYETLPFERDAKIVLYSKTSAGAYNAYRYLTSQGYNNLYVLEGGLILWQKTH